jgi:hypothetical protein
VVLALDVSRGPYIDDGFYTLPPYSRITRGDWGSPELEPSGFVLINIDKPMTGIDRRTYNILPLASYLQAAWYSIFGWGLVQQRLISTLIGLLGIAVWFDLVRRMSRDAILAGLAALLISFDWVYITGSTSGRMDMLGQTLGLLALYVHERCFASRPLLARLLSAAFLAATAMVHPNAFAVWCAVYMVRSALDWRQINLAQVGTFAVPVLAVLGLFGFWISYDFQAFRDQLTVQGTFRIASINPNEWVRYFQMYGLLPRPLTRDMAKVLPLITFLLAILLLILKPRKLTPASGFRTAIWLAVSAALTLAVVDSTKWPAYGIHPAPWLSVISAYVLRPLWTNSGRLLVTSWLCLYASVPCLSAAYVAKHNAMDTVYRPAVAALQNLTPTGAVVFAPPEFRFAFTGPFLFDVRLGFVSGRSVPAIAVEKEYLDVTLAWARNHNPALFTHVEQLVHHICSIRYENEKYAVYWCGLSPKA